MLSMMGVGFFFDHMSTPLPVLGSPTSSTDEYMRNAARSFSQAMSARDDGTLTAA